MTRHPLEPGDWIVYVPAYRTANGSTKVLGGPWRHGKLERAGVDGWTIVNASGGESFVMTRDIVRQTLSRGEAIDLVDRLTATQNEYIKARDALAPTFEQRVRDLLNK